MTQSTPSRRLLGSFVVGFAVAITTGWLASLGAQQTPEERCVACTPPRNNASTLSGSYNVCFDSPTLFTSNEKEGIKDGVKLWGSYFTGANTNIGFTYEQAGACDVTVIPTTFPSAEANAVAKYDLNGKTDGRGTKILINTNYMGNFVGAQGHQLTSEAVSGYGQALRGPGLTMGIPLTSRDPLHADYHPRRSSSSSSSIQRARPARCSIRWSSS
jgi:hypothetical protein